jgi:hypothetical protein
MEVVELHMEILPIRELCHENNGWVRECQTHRSERLREKSGLQSSSICTIYSLAAFDGLPFWVSQSNANPLAREFLLPRQKHADLRVFYETRNFH